MIDVTSLDFSSFDEVPEPVRFYDHPKLSMTAQSVLSMSTALQTQAGKQRRFRIRLSKDGRYILLCSDAEGRRGWCAAAKVIYEKLAREKAALDFARYGQVSLDAPVSAQVPIPRMELLHSRCGDFQNGVCLRDYVGQLPVDAKFMARRFMDGDTMDEIRDLNHWGARRTVRALRVLEAAMRRYCQI